MKLFNFQAGSIPLMVSIPHAGVTVPDDLRARLSPLGQTLRDTDWFLERLYDFPELKNASIIASQVSRYVVDLNRSASNENLYPGQNTTGLCSSISFSGEPLYQPGDEPTEDEIKQRVNDYWRPYHTQLKTELERLVYQFGQVVLLDAHSIVNEVPRLFEGRLPDFNFGTNHGQTCAAEMNRNVEAFTEQLAPYDYVFNGRFVGGFITRNYGSSEKVHAIQLELSQATYMNQQTLEWDQQRADQVQPKLRSFVESLKQWIQSV